MSEKAQFRLAADDLVAASWLYSSASFKRPRVLVSYGVLYIIAVGILAALFPASSPLGFVLLLGIALMPFVVIAALLVWLIPHNARSIFKSQRSLQGEMSLSWTAENLAVTSEYGSFAMPWSHFVAWREDDNVFLVYESERLYRIIPKRVLSDPQQDDLRRRLQTITA